MAKISQREARRLRKRVGQLERVLNDQLLSWAKEWPLGKQIGRDKVSPDSSLLASIITARKLEHAVVAVGEEDGSIYYIALPLAKRG